MESARSRVLNDFPYPVAYPYSLVFEEGDKPSNRRWALCFTVYQLLRMVCLPLVGQYLREPIDETAHDSIRSLNIGIGSIRSPFFSDWIALVYTLARHLSKVGIEPLFASLNQALEALKQREDRSVGHRGNHRLDPLNAVLALRNGTAHGGIPDEKEAAEHLEAYLPVLHQILEAFDFLGDTALKVCTDEPHMVAAGRAMMRSLRGAHLGEPAEEELPDEVVTALEESSSVLTVPGGKTVPLYPLFNPVSEREALYLYDGHYGIRVETAQGPEERSYIYYLGTHHRATESTACDRLKQLLDARRISFFLEKDQVAPWTIAESAADYSRRMLDWLMGDKYIPECYVPFPDLDGHFKSFLHVPPAQTWPDETTSPRFVNGFILTGLAGAGKTAFLASQVKKLLDTSSDHLANRENPNLVMFLRGDGMAVRSEGMSLFADVAEKLGIAVEGATARERKRGGFGSFRELLEHLHGRWKKDQVEGRRLILVLDALNEAPNALTIIREALELVKLAACYPWCKVVFSTRQEWLSVLTGKMGPQETSPMEELRPHLYTLETARLPGAESGAFQRDQGPPVVMMEPFTEEQAREVYERYQERAVDAKGPDRNLLMPACLTLWGELAPKTRDLLLNPLHLHLFMETFRGETAAPVASVPALFRRYVDHALALRPGLEGSIEAVIARLLHDLTRPGADLSDDDVNAIRSEWAKALRPDETPLNLSPVEGLIHEGWIRKRVREDGGGYRFVFQAVAEYLIYRHLRRERVDGEDELAYWTRRASPLHAFPEYAGAFGFLLRDWMAAEGLDKAAPLVENSAPWSKDVLTAFLIEQARTRYVPGQGSLSAETAARALAGGAGEQTADALFNAAYELASTCFALAAAAYFKICIPIRERLFEKNPENVSMGYGLGSALNNLGLLLGDAGRMDEADQVFRRSVEISERLFEKNPEDVSVGDGLGGALNNLGTLLGEAGRVDEAKQVYRRSVEIGKRLFENNPENVSVGYGLGWALSNLGVLLRDAGRVAEAERVYRRSVEISERLFEKNPENVSVGDGLGVALTNLGLLLSDAGRVDEAEQVYRRSVEIIERLFENNPENVSVGDGLGLALNNLGILLSDAGRMDEAERVYRRSVEISERLFENNPENVSVGYGLGLALNNLGNLLPDAGRVDEAEPIYRRSVEISERLFEKNPENVSVGYGLGSALTNLGLLLRDAGRVDEAEQVFRRSVEIRERLFKKNPGNIEIKAGYAGSLCSVGRFAEAEQLVEEVLVLVPEHPYALQLKRYIESTQKRPTGGSRS